MFRSNSSSRARTATVLALGLSVVLGVNCTFITARTNGQCLNDGDCRARGASFAQTRCSATGTCELVTVPEAGANAGGPCQTNAECNQRLSTVARCVDTQCVAITNANCPSVTGDSSAQDAVFFGVMTPQTGPNAEYGLNQKSVITTAAAEWTQQIAGIAGTHPIVVIGCDELADPAGAAAFLSTTVQAEAIFGPIYDGDFEAAIPISAANGTFLFGSRADDPKLSTFFGVGKTAWSAAPSRNIQVKYFQSLMNTLEPSVKATFSISGDMKVAFAVGADTSSTNFADALEASSLTFNGKSLATNKTNGTYTRVPVQLSFTTDNNYATAIGQLAATTPDLVIVAQEYDLLNFVRAVNTAWPGGKFPRFLLLTEDPAVDSEALLVNPNSSPSSRFAGRLEMVTWSRTDAEKANTAAFAADYRNAAGSDAAAFSELLYDAFYENTYAMQAVLNQNGNTTSAIDPGAYASAILSFNSPGTLVNVGVGQGSPSNIATGLGLLSGGDMDLDGASGGLEFDATSASPVMGAELKCVTTFPKLQDSGVRFDGTTGAATGVYSCL